MFVLEKCTGTSKAAERRGNRIKVVQVLNVFSKDVRENIQLLFKHLSQYIDKGEFADDHIEVYWSSSRQGDLTEGEWNLFVRPEHKQKIAAIEKGARPLTDFCLINQGLVSGADCVTEENIKLLTQGSIDEFGIEIGDGIFYVTEAELNTRIRPTEKEYELIKRVYKASEVTPYLPTRTPNESLYCLYVTKNTVIRNYPRILSHLEKYRNILERKREFQEGKLPWYSMHWPRGEEIFKGEKLVVSIWPSANDFGYSHGDYYAERNIFLVRKKPEVQMDPKYILGVLNSKTMGEFLARKGSKRGEKYFFPKEFCQKLPIKPIETKTERALHDKIVKLVDEMIKYRANLLQLLAFIADEQFINKKYFDDTEPPISEKALVHSLGWEHARPIRRNESLAYSLGHVDGGKFTLSKVQLSGENLFEKESSLNLIGSDGSSIKVRGDGRLLSLMVGMLEAYKGKSLNEILSEIELPIDPNLLERKKQALLSEIGKVTRTITEVQDSLDGYVKELYGAKE